MLKYFDEISTKPDGKQVYKKKYNSMVITGIYDKKTNDAKTYPTPTLLTMVIFLGGLLLYLLPAAAIVIYYLIKAPSRTKEFRERLEKEVGSRRNSKKK